MNWIKKIFQYKNTDKEMRLKAYEIAIQARENLRKDYNTWMNFFYIINGALIVAFTGEKLDENTKILLAFIGLVVSIGWSLSCIGHRYWVESWTSIVKKKEKEYFGSEGVYNLRIGKETMGKSPISTPRVVLVLSYIASGIWLSYIIYLYYDYNLDKCCIVLYFIASLVIVLIITHFLRLFFKTPDEKGSNKDKQ